MAAKRKTPPDVGSDGVAPKETTVSKSSHKTPQKASVDMPTLRAAILLESIHECDRKIEYWTAKAQRQFERAKNSKQKYERESALRQAREALEQCEINHRLIGRYAEAMAGGEMPAPPSHRDSFGEGDHE